VLLMARSTLGGRVIGRCVGVARRTARLAVRVMVLLVAVATLAVVVLRFVAPPATPLMALRVVQGDGASRHWTPLSRIAPAMVQAAIAAEDNGFCRHHGIDVAALQRALHADRSGQGLFGGSTISNQTAKNVFLWPHRDLVRKVVEFPLTGMIELVWGKSRIMETYLNVVELGRGIFGVETAAERYFHTSAARLNAHQAALLAAALPDPRHSNVVSPSPALAARAATIETRMAAVAVRQGSSPCS
jgi:monofunctional glycosyltransferase